MPSEAGVGEEMQLTPEQHRSSLPGATYTWGFFNKYIGNFFLKFVTIGKNSQLNHVALEILNKLRKS